MRFKFGWLAAIIFLSASQLWAVVSGFQADSTARAIYYEQFGDTASGDSNFTTNTLFYDGTGFPTALVLAQSGTLAAGGCGYQLTYPSLAVTMDTSTDTLGSMENDTKVLVVDTLAYTGILGLSDTIREFLYLNTEGPAGICGQPPDPVGKGLTIEAFPNPFSCGLNIRLGGVMPGKGNITIYNLLGQNVKTLHTGDQSSIIYWDGRDRKGRIASAGIYYIVLSNARVKIVKTKRK